MKSLQWGTCETDLTISVNPVPLSPSDQRRRCIRFTRLFNFFPLAPLEIPFFPETDLLTPLLEVFIAEVVEAVEVVEPLAASEDFELAEGTSPWMVEGVVLDGVIP